VWLITGCVVDEGCEAVRLVSSGYSTDNEKMSHLRFGLVLVLWLVAVVVAGCKSGQAGVDGAGGCSRAIVSR
jgi:hypothetical protein